MAIDKFLNQPFSELDFLKVLTEEIQNNYEFYKNECYFLKLSNLGNKLSEISWVKTFPSAEAQNDFYYDTKFMRACMMFKFSKRANCYTLLCSGYYCSAWFEILPEKTLRFWPDIREALDLEEWRMPSRELIERAFGEISQAVKSSKSGIPM